jgi:hypothetical protein
VIPHFGQTVYADTWESKMGTRNIRNILSKVVIVLDLGERQDASKKCRGEGVYL